MQGDAYYKLDKYGDALREYEAAYIAKPDPSFLYNIAQCHRLMGSRGDALRFYRRYLKDAPAAANRAIAEKHIRELETSLAQGPERGDNHGRAVVAVSPPPPTSPELAAPGPTSTPGAPIAPLPPASVAMASAGSPPPPSLSPTSASALDRQRDGDQRTEESQDQARPFYTKWWFWTAVGVVVGGTLIVIATSGSDPSCPPGSVCR